MHFTRWYFTVANAGVKHLFHPANNSSYEVCSCYPHKKPSLVPSFSPLPSVPLPSVPLSSVPLPSVTFFTSVPTVNKHLPVLLLGTELCIPLKIFAGLSKHLPVFLLGTENVMGGWMAILVVVCGKMCGKIEEKKLCARSRRGGGRGGIDGGPL